MYIGYAYRVCITPPNVYKGWYAVATLKDYNSAAGNNDVIFDDMVM